MKNCIFISVFTTVNYVKMLYMLLESLYIFGNLNDNIDILIYTTTEYMNMIKQSNLYCKNMVFEINDNYNDVDSACKARLDLFDLESVKLYEKILYLDTDILVKKYINKLFELVEKEILYVLEEGFIDHPNDSWGYTLFGDEVHKYEDKSGFTSGILLFKNCETIKNLFVNIKEDIIRRPYNFTCFDQPYFIYNAFKYGLYDNKILKSYTANHNYDGFNDIIVHHFPGAAGYPFDKLKIMDGFLYYLKGFVIEQNINITKNYIINNLLPIIYNCNEPLEGNIFMLNRTTDFTDMYINKVKNLCSFVLNPNVKNIMEIGFNSGFSTLLMLISNPSLKITCYDLGNHSYTIPCFQKIKETFGDRINLIIGDSRETLLNDVEKYDLIHIDGGHELEVAESDIKQSHRLSRIGSVLIFDDYDLEHLKHLWDFYINMYNLKEPDLLIYKNNNHDIKVRT